MSNLVAQGQMTPEQLSLIKSTIAKNATDEEMKLFLYRAHSMGLDPLKPGLIHFVKYGSGPGTIVVGIDGFRAKAQATGMMSGITRGTIDDDNGNCIGGWCEVWRKDWTKPAREEVPMVEYDTGKGPWAKMPRTMIKKVAEAAALRMAFPDELGGVYTKEEMDQAERDVRPYNPDPKTQTATDLALRPAETLPPLATPATPGEYVVRIGKKYVGQMLRDINTEDLEGFMDWIRTKGNPSFQNASATKEFMEYAAAYIAETLSEMNELDQALLSKVEDNRQ